MALGHVDFAFAVAPAHLLCLHNGPINVAVFATLLIIVAYDPSFLAGLAKNDDKARPCFKCYK